MLHVSVIIFNLLLAIFIFEKLSFDEFKEQISQRMLRRLKRLRQRVVSFMGDHYLVDVGLKEASTQIKCVDEAVNSESDICKFLDRVLPERLNVDKPPWIVYIFPNYSQDESAMIFIGHHMMGDGLSAQYAWLCSSDEEFDVQK